nr:MAG: DNA-binding response regulator [Bacillota bacterium]
MEKLLLIEDDLAIGELLVERLAEEGFEVHWERTGTSGLTAALNGNYDLVLLDIMLPGINGFDICREVRRHRRMPILMLTARTEEEEQVLGLGLGADDYITKPFSLTTLVARIRAHLRRFRLATAETGIIQVGPLVIDPVACRVTRNGRELNLTAKEFELLLHFARNPNRVFTRGQLYEAVWKEPYLGDDNTVMVHIRRLREKIQPEETDPELIQTVRGLGYRFVVV